MHTSKFIVCSAIIASVFSISESRAQEATKQLESSIALGVTVNDGNTDNSMYNAGLMAAYTTDDGNTLRLGADLAYGENDGEKSTDNYKVELDYRHLLSERAYAAFNTSVSGDDIADIDYRWIIAPGAGYYLMKKENVSMVVEGGPALIIEKKGGEKEENFALRIAERYERKMETNAKFWQSLEYLPLIDDFEIYILNAEIGVEAPISEKLNVRLSVKDTYDSDPAPGRKHNDVTVIGALAYSLF